MVDARGAAPDRLAHGGTRSTTLDPDRAIATVAGHAIRTADLERRTASLRRGPRGRHVPPDDMASAELRRWIVRELVTEATLVHEAQAAGILGPGDGAVALTPEVIGRLVDRVTGAVTVDGDAARTFYTRNPDRFHRPETRRISHAILVDEAAAGRVAEGLADGQPLETAVAPEIDGGSGRVRVESARDLRRGELVGPLEDAVFDSAPGQVVGPMRTEHGWHVARLDGVMAASTISYPAARPAIEADLLAEARIRAFEVWLEERRTALAVVDPDFGHPADPANGLATHRH